MLLGLLESIAVVVLPVWDSLVGGGTDRFVDMCKMCSGSQLVVLTEDGMGRR